MTTLAVRLDELAQANSEGLLNDDEYRVLRQDLFEKYARRAPIVAEQSSIPTLSGLANVPDPSLLGRPDVTFEENPRHPRKSDHPRSKSKSTSLANPHSAKTTTTLPKSGRNLFLRRTTAKRDETPSQPTPLPKEKKAFIPKLSFTRKLSNMALNLVYLEGSSSREKEQKRETDGNKSHTPKLSSYSSSNSTFPSIPPMSPSRSSGSSTSEHSRSTPLTPTSTMFSTYSSSPRPSNATSLSLSPTKMKRSRAGSTTSQRSRPTLSPTTFAPTPTPSSTSEIFDDANLGSTASIRGVLGATQVEMGKLVDMFEEMEGRAIERLEQHCQSFGVASPHGTSSSSLRPRTKTPTPSITGSSSSLRSGGLRRKASLSSLASSIGASSSYTNLFTSVGSGATLAPPQAHVMGRSRSGSLAGVAEDGGSGNLVPMSSGPMDHHHHHHHHYANKQHKTPLPSLRSIRSAGALSTSSKLQPAYSTFQAMECHNNNNDDISGTTPSSQSDGTLQGLQKELADIRRKKDQVVWRYEARLEYLRVRLKGAELAKKVARR